MVVELKRDRETIEYEEIVLSSSVRFAKARYMLCIISKPLKQTCLFEIIIQQTVNRDAK